MLYGENGADTLDGGAGYDTLVHLSNGGTVTLLGVTLTSVDDLFPPPEAPCSCGQSIDTLLV